MHQIDGVTKNRSRILIIPKLIITNLWCAEGVYIKQQVALLEGRIVALFEFKSRENEYL